MTPKVLSYPDPKGKFFFECRNQWMNRSFEQINTFIANKKKLTVRLRVSGGVWCHRIENKNKLAPYSNHWQCNGVQFHQQKQVKFLSYENIHFERQRLGTGHLFSVPFDDFL
jgi:hypothetical protein